MTEGQVGVAFDELIHGRPLAPVFVGPSGMVETVVETSEIRPDQAGSITQPYGDAVAEAAT